MLHPARIQILFRFRMFPGRSSPGYSRCPGHGNCPWADAPWLEQGKSRALPQTAGLEQSGRHRRFFWRQLLVLTGLGLVLGLLTPLQTTAIGCLFPASCSEWDLLRRESGWGVATRGCYEKDVWWGDGRVQSQGSTAQLTKESGGVSVVRDYAS